MLVDPIPCLHSDGVHGYEDGAEEAQFWRGAAVAPEAMAKRVRMRVQISLSSRYCPAEAQAKSGEAEEQPGDVVAGAEVVVVDGAEVHF